MLVEVEKHKTINLISLKYFDTFITSQSLYPTELFVLPVRTVLRSWE